MSSQPTAIPKADLTAGQSLVTLQSFILAEEARHPEATGAFSWILSALSISAKVIASKMRRARLEDVLGSLDQENVQGETQQKLDVIANEVLIRALGSREGVAIVASEENDEALFLRDDKDGDRRYCVLFDPLDGSSNLDTAGGVGTIFSILRHDRRAASAEESLMQSGSKQVAAGYILYGSSTVFTLTTGDGVSMFVLDPSIGAFILVSEKVTIPKAAKTYSCNEGNRLQFGEGYQKYLGWAQENGYSSRYAGAMVADVHRALIKGGVFLYPPTTKAPAGKLRLMYEANPMAMIMEQAGGKAYAHTTRLMDVEPTEIHQRCPVLMGSPDEVDHVLKFIQE